MKLIPSPHFHKDLRGLDPQTQERLRRKIKLLLRDKMHSSLRYKTVQALKNENPPVKEISITMSIRVTLQEVSDHIYPRNIRGHNVLP